MDQTTLFVMLICGLVGVVAYSVSYKKKKKDEFMETLKSGSHNEIEYAIIGGAKIDFRDEQGRSPLMIVAQYNPDPYVFAVLLRVGIGKTLQTHAENIDECNKYFYACLEERDKTGRTALMLAAGYNPNAADVMKGLLHMGASINARSDEPPGWTPLMFAAWNNSGPSILSTLIEAGAEVNIRSTTGGTPLMTAALFSINNNALSVLVGAGARIDDQDDLGRTALMFAARGNENAEIVSLLLSMGANKNIKCKAGKTAYDYGIVNIKLNGRIQHYALKP